MILIIEDGKIARKQIRALLADLLPDKPPVFVSNLNSGKDVLDCNEVSLLITDIMFLDGDGLKLVAVLRSDELFQSLPIIIMSAIFKDDNVNEEIRGLPNHRIIKFIKKPLKKAAFSKLLKGMI